MLGLFEKHLVNTYSILQQLIMISDEDVMFLTHQQHHQLWILGTPTTNHSWLYIYIHGMGGVKLLPYTQMFSHTQLMDSCLGFEFEA